VIQATLASGSAFGCRPLASSTTIPRAARAANVQATEESPMKLSALALIAFAAAPLHAQMTMAMDHDGPLPKQPAQSAYAAIGEIARILKADSTTDWSKVNLEALRQHLIDMDEVTMRSQVSQQPVPGGITMMVTGDAKVG